MNLATLPEPEAQTAVVAADFSAPVAAPALGRVLLLEDDASLKEIIRDYLAESGYEVVAVQNGVDGLHAVLEGDFAVVLCDMMMPTLPGETFYRAIERLRPHLAPRFIFMTGHRGNSQTMDFLQSINGLVLNKPFPMGDLLETVGKIRERERSTKPPTPPRARPQTTPIATPPGAVVPRPAPAARTAAPDIIRFPQPQIEPRPPVAATPTPPIIATPAPAEPPQVESRSFTGGDWIMLALCALPAVLLAAWFVLLGERVSAAHLELSGVESEWSGISKELAQAESLQPEWASTINLPTLVRADRQSVACAAALHSVAVSVGSENVIRVLRARKLPEDPNTGEVRIEGYSLGATPQASAERFRKTLESDLVRQYGPAVDVAFLKTDTPVATPGISAEAAHASFVIIANFSLKPPQAQR